jgi:hypothetical protein
VRDFRHEVYRLCRAFIKFLFAEKPPVAADSALEFRLGFYDSEFGVFEAGWFELRKRKLEYAPFNLLQFADFYCDFFNLFQFFFFGDLLCGGEDCFCQSPFMHIPAYGSAL